MVHGSRGRRSKKPRRDVGTQRGPGFKLHRTKAIIHIKGNLSPFSWEGLTNCWQGGCLMAPFGSDKLSIVEGTKKHKDFRNNSLVSH